jgi:hypothetical protein
MKNLLFITILISFMSDASEELINAEWCIEQEGITEYRTIYGTYIDCLTEDFAIEVEYDYNWKESIGQALHYAEATNRNPGILFIKRSKSKKNYLNELHNTIDKFNLPITVFVISN